MIDRARGSEPPAVFGRMETSKKRMEASRAASIKFGEEVAREIELLRLQLNHDDDVD